MSVSDSDLRVGFLTGKSIVQGANGRYLTDVGLGRVVNDLATRFPRLRLAARLETDDTSLHHDEIAIDPACVVLLPPADDFQSGMRATVPYWSSVRQFERASDVMVVQQSFHSPLALLPARGPRVYHIVGDVRAMSALPSRHGFGRLVARAAGNLTHLTQRLLIADSRSSVVTNGSDLWRTYAPLRGAPVVSSALFEREIGSVKRHAATDGGPRVLFIGYLRPEKGVPTLLEAFDRLLRRIPGASLELVGPGDLSHLDPASARRLEDLEVDGILRRHGSVPFGPDLFQLYADADILVLPSLTEGTPRVLVEARAFGCPVVATSVGGIPTSVENEVDGLLVPPGDVAALADAMLRLATDEPLRQRLVDEGLRRAPHRTVEHLSSVLAGEVIAVHSAR